MTEETQLKIAKWFLFGVATLLSLLIVLIIVSFAWYHPIAMLVSIVCIGFFVGLVWAIDKVGSEEYR